VCGTRATSPRPARGPKRRRRRAPRAKPGNRKARKKPKPRGESSHGVRPETWGGGGAGGWGGGGGIRPPWQPRFCSWCPRAAASPPAHRLNAAAPATTTVLGICRSASSSCCSGPWRSLEPCVFHESVTIVRVGSVGCWFAFIIVYHSVRIIYVSCVAGLCRR